MDNQDIVNKATQLLKKIEMRLADSSGVSSLESSPVGKIPTPPPKNITFVPHMEQPKNIEWIESPSTQRSSQLNEINSLSEKVLIDNYDNLSQESLVLEDIAIIQGFYGNDIRRIEATTRALNKMLKMNPRPESWVFVEALKSKKFAVFGWLENYGVKYIFKKIPPESQGLMLKTALWNIGADYIEQNNLCFIDSDIVFCNSSWLQSVSDAFTRYDVLSLAGYCYYERSQRYKSVTKSIGYNIMKSTETNFNGHLGFNIGMKRSVYKMYGKFEAFNMHDDMWIWQRIVGSDNMKDLLGWTPYKSDSLMKFGMPVTIGSTEEICCHLNHGDDITTKYKAFGLASYYGTSEPFEDIKYDRALTDVLPEWSQSKIGMMMKDVFKLISENEIDPDCDDMESQIEEFFIKTYLEMDASQIVIVSTFEKSYKFKNFDSVAKHIESLKNSCKVPFLYVCFTDEDNTGYDIDVIPRNRIKISLDQKTFVISKDVKFPKNAKVIYVPISQQKLTIFDIIKM